MVFENTFSGVDFPATPLKTILPTHLVFVLLNAAKELAAQDDTLFGQTQGLDASISAHTQQIGDLDARITQLASGGQTLFQQIQALDARVTTLEQGVATTKE